MKTYLSQKHLLGIMMSKLIISCLLLLSIAPSLLPDEAQYWVWSRHLDWGYYSKPAGIAYQIFCSTFVLGDFSWAVRLPSVILSLGSAWFLYRLALKLYPLSTYAVLVSLLFSFSPLALYGSFSATTDSGLLFCWCMILWALELKPTFSRSWLLVAAACMGVLFKPTITVLIIAQFFRHGVALKRKFTDAGCLLLGCLIGSFGFLIWNSQHDWVTFKHIATQLGAYPSMSNANQASLGWLRPWQFLGTQALLVSPVLLFWALKAAVQLVIAQPQSMQAKNMRWHSFVVLAAFSFCLLSCLKVKYQANWIAFIYPQLFLLTVYSLQKMTLARAVKITYWHCGLHTSLFLAIIYIAWAQQHPGAVLSQTPYTLNAFRPAMGWTHIDHHAERLAITTKDSFIISDKYQTVSQLSFYLPHSQVYWFNLHGARQNQYSFWPVDPSWLGKNAFFIAIENASVEEMTQGINLYLQRVVPYFERIDYWQVMPFFERAHKVEKSILCVKLVGYKGTRPSSSKHY